MQNTKQKFHKSKKSLGQNFLKSKLALTKLIQAGEVEKKDIILEIGPGKGVLTQKLLSEAGLVIAVEKDKDLFIFLEEKFKQEISEKKLILLNEDILKFPYSVDSLKFWQDVLEFSITDKVFLDSPRKFSVENFLCPSSTLLPRVRSKTLCPPLLKYKIIANIPYNITGAILKKFLTSENQPERMVLMIQKEVAQRIIGMKKTPTSHKATQGKDSLLSISVKAYGEPKMIMKVPARYFSPAPKVDSAIILIKNISKDFFLKNKISEEKFWSILHLGFAHKRKKLSNNLKKIIKKLPPEYQDKRAEDLNLTDWLNLIK